MKFSLSAFLTLVAGGGLTALGAAIAALIPNQQVAALVTGLIGIFGLVAGIILQSQQPAAKIVQDAPVVNSTGDTVATNLSSTSSINPARVMPISSQNPPQ